MFAAVITRRRSASRKRGQQGYALLLVIFMATMLLIFATMAAPNIKTEGQREKEKEMIWRGQQYARAIKLYYRKMGRFPTSLDDLTKPKVGSLRFLRQAYKDPMNTKDGSWRLIYVGPAGQLIGSLKPHPTNIQFGQVSPGMGTPVTAMASPGAPNSGFGSVLGQAIGQVGGLNPQGPGGTPSVGSGGPGTSSTNLPITGNPVSADQGTGTVAATDGEAPIPTEDTPNIIGGNIIGVGSKVNKKSIMVYDKAKNYRLFEFIWDPSKDTFGIGQPGMQTGTGLGQPIGQPIGQPAGPSPFGQQPGQNPSPQPNPPQQQPQNPQQ
jgi:type II secretory pathway pseudopilin PulG